MSRMIFVHLPVADLDRSVAFFAGLGFGFDAQFTHAEATCMVVNDRACVMLLSRPFFSTFTRREPVDARHQVEAILAVSADSRDDVDTMVDEALASGGTPAGEARDRGFLYGRSFHDPDGHQWEVLWMDPAAA
ncbi:MAG: VOC family protein [Nocardioides sp.]